MADETTFEVIFRGDITAGQQLVAVKERLKALFKVDDARIEQLFSGRPEVIKKGVDQATADRYRDTLLKAGAVVQVREQAAQVTGSGAIASPPPVAQSATLTNAKTAGGDSGSAHPSASELTDGLSPDAVASGAVQVASDAPDSRAEWTLAPVGADVLRPDERHQVQPVVVGDIEFELAPAGADLLKPEERSRVEAPEIDISHLTVDTPGDDKEP